ncbi:hypothetical protein Trydic_g17989 [Trypoxylus dichotomus]
MRIAEIKRSEMPKPCSSRPEYAHCHFGYFAFSGIRFYRIKLAIVLLRGWFFRPYIRKNLSSHTDLIPTPSSRGRRSFVDEDLRYAVTVRKGCRLFVKVSCWFSTKKILCIH